MPIGNDWGANLQNDGSDYHLGVQRRVGQWSLALVAIRPEDVGPSVSYRPRVLATGWRCFSQHGNHVGVILSLHNML